MQRTETKLHAEARKTILKGVRAVANPVKVTLGPEGAGVLLDRAFNRGSRITNDGVSVAKNVRPKDEFEALVATAFTEGASKTAERVGDGTTSTIVIAASLIEQAFKVLPASDGKDSTPLYGLEGNGMGVVSLKKHLLAAVPKIKEAIKDSTKKIETQEDLENIIDVSLAGNREVAKILADMVWKTGPDGFITLADGFRSVLETEVIEGARFPLKIAAPRFMNHPERYEMVAEDCPCIVTNHALDSVGDFASFWNILKPTKLIIFAPSFSEQVLVQMVKLISPREMPDGSVVPSGVKIFPVKCASLGSEDTTPHNFVDLAIFCDAKFVDKNKGDKLGNIREHDLGFLEKLTVKSVEDREDAVLLGGKGAKSDKVKIQIESIRSRVELTKMPAHKMLMQKRIASLASVGGLIRVGAPTDAEALPLKHKIEDAIFAGQAALKHGYVQGGGLCLKTIADDLFKDDKLIYEALAAPYTQILENVGDSMFTVGKDIIDPARVVELEVEHGFGVAANLITVKAIIPEFDERDPRDANKAIAEAILTGVLMWAKQQGLYNAGLDETKTEELQRREALMDQEND